MMTSPLPLPLVFLGGLVCLLAGGFFSGSETGIMSASRARVRRLQTQGTRGRSVTLLEQMLGEVEDTILSCLIGTNLFNVLFSALVTMAVTERLGRDMDWLAVILVAVLVILFAEILPKVMYREFPERMMLVSVIPLSVAKKILWPVRVLLGQYSAAWHKVLPAQETGGALDRRSLAALLLSYSVPGGHEKRFSLLVDRFLKLASLDLKSVMQPLDTLVTVSPDTTVADCLKLAAASGFSRFPVIEKGNKVLHGYILIRDLLFLSRDQHSEPVPRELWRNFLLVDSHLTPYELFGELRNKGEQLVMMIGPEGLPQGMITLEDLIETVVGSINDEFDPVIQVNPS